MRRYGFRLAGEPQVIVDPGARFQALIEGRADLAVGYATDGAITGLGLTALDDPLDFFPPYAAAILVRDEALEEENRLRPALERLSIDIETMRRLNYAVQVEGQDPKTVAEGFLEAEDLLEAEGSSSRSQPLVVVLDRRDDLPAEKTRALRAVRETFPGRPIESGTASDPAGVVAAGKAGLAILGAERFFPTKGEPERRLEAVAVLGSRLVHLIRRADEPPPRKLFAGKIGVPPRGSGAGEVGAALLEAADQRAHLEGELATLLDGVASKRIDAALVLASPGRAEIARAFAKGGLVLGPLDRWLSSRRAVRYPFLRHARVPAETYTGQQEAVETLGVQVLLAGATRSRTSTTGAGGPAAALPSGGQPLTAEEVDRLVEATGVLEVPDPALPSPWTSGDPLTAGTAEGCGVFDSVVNVFVVVFLGWLGLLVLRRRSAAR
jgi:hypothetical protein